MMQITHSLTFDTGRLVYCALESIKGYSPQAVQRVLSPFALCLRHQIIVLGLSVGDVAHWYRRARVHEGTME